jgi:hypothetical protein
MRKKTNLRSKEIGEGVVVPLNRKLYNEFSIQELEKRLETDPLLLSSLFGIGLSSDDDGPLRGDCGCDKIKNCPELQCGIKNT